MNIEGSWALETWRRSEVDGSVSYPFGEKPNGILIYTPDGHMAVQMVEANRALLDTDDALGGSEAERAQAYSSCLAYFGRYRIEGRSVVHELNGSLYPNWSGTDQARPFVLDQCRLVLQVEEPDGRISNEIIWRRLSS